MVPAGRRNLARPVANTSPVANVRYDVSLLHEDELSSFGSGSHHQLYEKLGAHPLAVENQPQAQHQRSQYPEDAPEGQVTEYIKKAVVLRQVVEQMI